MRLSATTPTTHQPVRSSATVKTHKFFPVAVLASVTLSLLFAPASEARDCPTTRGGIYHVSARHMSCSTALGLISRVRYIGPESRTAYLKGWSCKNIGDYPEGASFRCNRGTRTFRWMAGG
jgi:hypothetical protein